MSKAKAKVTVVSYEEFTDIEFKSPSAFFTRNYLGEYVFYHTRSREVAQEWCNNLHGTGMYTVNSSRISKSKGELSVSGSETRRK